MSMLHRTTHVLGWLSGEAGGGQQMVKTAPPGELETGNSP
jgi:hypothetical protein